MINGTLRDRVASKSSHAQTNRVSLNLHSSPRKLARRGPAAYSNGMSGPDADAFEMQTDATDVGKPKTGGWQFNAEP